MNRAFSALVGALVFATSTLALAQEESTKDGVWLKTSIDAFNRIASAEYIDVSSPDFRKSEILSAYIEGMLYVHRQNNFYASLIAVTTQERRDVGTPVAPEARTALAFAPLLRVPDKISRYQVVAILDQYLKAHPERWNEPAGGIITKALEAAFDNQSE